MSAIAIRAEGLGKEFHIGELQSGRKTFREVAVDAFLDPLRRVRRLANGHATGAADLQETIWALRNIDFEIHHGEVVGVIGRNGAGKSTLLKILSRITEPTRGFVEVRGKVGSLLEVGTGFHSELTGRENVYLNGAILGMRKAEIDRKFDEIVSFSEIGRFLDTPVKHYSTGMETRLGFAVAAHLDTEILLVDEVLSVGDVTFQKKCLGKMQDVAKGGRTVIFVSHNMATVSQLCERAIWLCGGTVKASGDPSTVISEYLSDGSQPRSLWTNPSENDGRGEARINSVRVLNSADDPTSIVDFGRDCKIEIAYQVNQPTRNLTVDCQVVDQRGVTLWSSWDIDSGDWNGRVRMPGQYLSICHVPGSILRPGRYFLSIGMYVPYVKAVSLHESVLSVDISDVGCGLVYPNRCGAITPVLKWDVIPLNQRDVVSSQIE